MRSICLTAMPVWSKRKSTSLGGGILGTAAFVVLLVSSTGGGN